MAELATENGGELEDAAALLREVADAPADDVPHAFGDCDRALRPVVLEPLEREQAHRLREEQRIPSRLLVELLDDHARAELAGGELHVLGDGGRAEAGQREATGD